MVSRAKRPFGISIHGLREVNVAHFAALEAFNSSESLGALRLALLDGRSIAVDAHGGLRRAQQGLLEALGCHRVPET